MKNVNTQYMRSLFDKASKLIKENHQKKTQEGSIATYDILDINMTYNSLNVVYVISTNALKAIYRSGQLEMENGSQDTLEKLIKRLEKYQTQRIIASNKLLESNVVEIKGIVTEENNGDGYDFAEWCNLEDEITKQYLQNILSANIGRKAKIRIEFED